MPQELALRHPLIPFVKISFLSALINRRTNFPILDLGCRKMQADSVRRGGTMSRSISKQDFTPVIAEIP
jgi:hypothetical protein